MLITVDYYKTWVNYTNSDRDAAYAIMVSQLDAAIKKKLRNPIEQATYVEYYDAPTTDALALRWTPVYPTGLQVIVVPFSAGNPASFVNVTPLVVNQDYTLQADQPDGSSRCGLLRRYNQVWGYSYFYPPTRLAGRLDPDRQSVQVTYTAGYLNVPADLQEAACLAVSMLYQARQLGQQVVSASLNGASYSVPATADGILDSPVIWPLLQPYADVFVGNP